MHAEQLERVERFNGRAAMLGFVIGVITEAITGQGIIHQIGLGPLVDGYAACSTKFLPFCF
ncbi:MAG: chlorophyll a/b-binding protein [Cyanobacteriota bacterium]|nr:chlorophyll a/b-binding protein [Cyanobacteriota bacterium]